MMRIISTESRKHSIGGVNNNTLNIIHSLSLAKLYELAAWWAWLEIFLAIILLSPSTWWWLVVAVVEEAGSDSGAFKARQVLVRSVVFGDYYSH